MQHVCETDRSCTQAGPNPVSMGLPSKSSPSLPKLFLAAVVCVFSANLFSRVSAKRNCQPREFAATLKMQGKNFRAMVMTQVVRSKKVQNVQSHAHARRCGLTCNVGLVLLRSDQKRSNGAQPASTSLLCDVAIVWLAIKSKSIWRIVPKQSFSQVIYCHGSIFEIIKSRSEASEHLPSSRPQLPHAQMPSLWVSQGSSVHRVDAAPPRLLGAKLRAGEGPVLVDELCIRQMPARH